MSNENIKKNFASGIFYTFLSKYSNIIINIGITAILARKLSPEEYGIVAVVLVFVTFFQTISQMGIGTAIIQNKELDEKNISDIFKFTIVMGILVGIAFYFSSYLIAYFYEDNVYVPIGQILSLTVAAYTINIVPNGIITRDKRFKQLGIISIVCNLLGGILAVVLAYLGFSYYALVIKSVFIAVSRLIATIIAAKIKMYRGYDRSSIKKIAKYSFFQFMFQVINYFSRNLDNILIGKYLGEAMLGLYDKAYRLMLYPVQNLSNVMSPVMHPILSDHQKDKRKIYDVYKKVTKYLLMIGVPIVVMLYFYPTQIIGILYGDTWLEIVPTFKILAISIIIQLVLTTSGSIFQSANRTDMLFLSGVLSAVTMISGITYGVVTGRLEAVATGILIAMTINFFQCYYLLIVKVLEQSLMDFFKNFASAIGIGLVLSAVNILLITYIPIETKPYIISLGIYGVINVIVWIALLFIFGESKFMRIDKIIKKIRK